MNFHRVIRSFLFATFAAFAAGGPGLHYAPFLGHHDCCDAGIAEVTSQACGCGRSHGQPNSDAEKFSRRDHGSSCHGHCLVCQFFSSVTFDSVACFSISTGEETCENLPARADSPNLQFIASFEQRGPPVA
ncbi:MAG: hypothetical protein VX768_13275 [Planctomycetota bacterium]|nr:hypothetical protein [Planctomycetota bacterium]